MKVDIWSDIRCPFCFIGKKKFEKALKNFEHRQEVVVQWHSYELNPELKLEKPVNYIEHFMNKKGIGEAEAMAMFKQVYSMGEEMGISFNIKDAIVANSFNAHRLIQYAITQDRGEYLIKLLFEAHFLNGLNIDNVDTLVKLAVDSGLNESDAEKVVNSDRFSQEVRYDEYQAQLIGIQGVPFFLFDEKYAIQGAQSVELMLKTLHKAYSAGLTVENNRNS